MKPSKKKRQEWSEAEIVVLCAIFLSSEFSAGDDEKPECKRIAAEFKRTTGTIDRQWRNIKDYLADRSSEKTGAAVKYWAGVSLEHPSLVKSLASHYAQTFNWKLTDLMETS